MNKVSVKKDKTAVLLVDDDSEWLDYISRTLGREYHVFTATNGEDALRVARRIQPAVIILDIIMAGGKDGFSVFSDLQKESATCDIPVIMLSDANLKTGLSFDSQVMRKQLGKAPAAYLEKSVSLKILIREIKKRLNKGSSTA